MRRLAAWVVLAALAAVLMGACGAGRPFRRGMVSLTFDDGWVSHATLVAPELTRRGWKGTFYLIPGWFGSDLDGEPFVTTEQARSIAALGHEIGDHTLDHPNLHFIEEPLVLQEIEQGRSELMRLLDLSEDDIVSFAPPHGGYDQRVLDDAAKLGLSCRTIDPHLDDADADPLVLGGFLLGIAHPDRDPDAIAELVHEAEVDKQWLILVFHGIAEGEIQRRTDEPKADFDRILDSVAAADVDVVTVREGVERLRAMK
ncbi:MAG: polysaccharide deacetylase family protein [Polyangiaceae bacterium]